MATLRDKGAQGDDTNNLFQARTFNSFLSQSSQDDHMHKLLFHSKLKKGYMTENAGPRRYECNLVFQIITREICNLVLKLHNPMKMCVTR